MHVERAREVSRVKQARRAHVFPMAFAISTFVAFCPALAQTDFDPVSYVKRADNGASLPFGMLQWKPTGTFYLNGAGCGRPRMLCVYPVWGSTASGPSAIEPVHPALVRGHWDLTKLGLNQEYTVGLRSGIARFTTNAQNPKMHVDVEANETEVVDKTTVIGKCFQENFCGYSQARTTFHFKIVFDRPFLESGGLSAPRVGRYFTFEPGTSGKVYAKVGVSWTSAQNAALNLAEEMPGWNFDSVAVAGREAWKNHLSVVRLSASTDPILAKAFYEKLYWVSLHPNAFSDVNGDFLGFDSKPHSGSAQNPHYHTFSGWDTYRSWSPLVSLLYPKQSGDIMQTLVDQANTGLGGFARWSIANQESGIMEGDPSCMMISSAYALGVRNFDTLAALAAMHRGASIVHLQSSPGFYTRPGLENYLRKGWVKDGSEGLGEPAEGGSCTMEYAIADFAISRFAAGIRNTDKEARYTRQCQNWKTLWNPSLGILVTPGSTLTSKNWAEGSAEMYVWLVPHNIRKLFDLMGGNEKAAERLRAHTIDFYRDGNKIPTLMEPGNEESFHVPFLFNWAGKPWMTQELTNRLLKMSKWGQEDLGAMSSRKVFMLLGLYPSIPGVAGFSLTSPSVPEATLQLIGDKQLIIKTIGLSATAMYIQKITVNGKEHNSPWLWLSKLDQKVNTLEFTLGETPNTSWGANPPEADAPPSWDAEPCFQENGCPWTADISTGLKREVEPPPTTMSFRQTGSQIVFGGAGITKWILLDRLGRHLLDGEHRGSARVDCSHVAFGTYTLRVERLGRVVENRRILLGVR